MNTTYLFKEETTNGQKKLRIGTAQEFAKVAEQNRALPIEKRRYFIKEKSLDPDSPDYLFIEVSREEYIQWNRENNARCKNNLMAKNYTMLSMESVLNSVNRGKADESALYGPESGYEEILDQAWLDELRKNLMEWRPWAGDLLDAYLEGDVSSCPGMLAEKYGVSLQTTRKYVRQFEQRLKSFLEGVSF